MGVPVDWERGRKRNGPPGRDHLGEGFSSTPYRPSAGGGGGGGGGGGLQRTLTIQTKEGAHKTTCPHPSSGDQP